MIESLDGLGGDIREPVFVYAGRFARKCLLEHICPPDHPVLAVEHQLIREAREHLQEKLLVDGWNRDVIECEIRRYACNKLTYLVDDSTTRKIVMQTIWNKSLDDIFPSIN